MSQPFPEVAALLPHEPPMIVIGNIHDAGDSWIESETRIETSHPLFEQDENGLPGWALIELMAQTVAAFAGLQAYASDEPVRIGYLLGTRRMTLNCNHVPLGDVLRIHAEREFHDPDGLGSFQCTIRNGGAIVLAEAKVNVYQSPHEGIPE